MSPDDISRFAASGKKPESLTILDELLYYRLRDIYSAAREGRITNKQGAEMKKTELLYHQGRVDRENFKNRLIGKSLGAEERKPDEKEQN